MAKKINVVVPGSSSVDALVKNVAGDKAPAQDKPVRKISKPTIEKRTQIKELKTAQLNIRVKESTKIQFENLCKEYNYSQSDFFEAMLSMVTYQLKKQ